MLDQHLLGLPRLRTGGTACNDFGKDFRKGVSGIGEVFLGKLQKHARLEAGKMGNDVLTFPRDDACPRHLTIGQAPGHIQIAMKAAQNMANLEDLGAFGGRPIGDEFIRWSNNLEARHGRFIPYARSSRSSLSLKGLQHFDRLPIIA